MFRALRTTTLMGVLAAVLPSAISAQATSPAAPPQGAPASPQATQASPQAAPDANATGEQTSGSHPALLDAQHRPITEGGFVKTGPIVFEDIS